MADQTANWAPPFQLTRAELTAKLEHDLTLHSPINQAVITSMEQMRQFAKQYGAILIHYGTPSRELSLAITKLEESLMWAIASVARYQDE